MTAGGRIYYWDFFGPRAQGTAEHFVEHLNAFLDRHGFAACETGTESRGPGHRAAWCRVGAAAPREVHDGIHAALRPRRHVEESPDAEASEGGEIGGPTSG